MTNTPPSQAEKKKEKPTEATNRELIIEIRLLLFQVLDALHQPPVIDVSKYKTDMHPIQKKLLAANEKGLLEGKGFRKIAHLVGAKHPQQVKHHLTQLKKHNLI